MTWLSGDVYYLGFLHGILVIFATHEHLHPEWERERMLRAELRSLSTSPWKSRLDIPFHCYHCCSVAKLCLLFATPWTAACQVSLSFTISRSLLKLMSFESVMRSNHLILCHPLLLLPTVFPSIRVFSNESALCIRWPKYWSFSFSMSRSSEYQWLFRVDFV